MDFPGVKAKRILGAAAKRSPVLDSLPVGRGDRVGDRVPEPLHSPRGSCRQSDHSHICTHPLPRLSLSPFSSLPPLFLSQVIGVFRQRMYGMGGQTLLFYYAPSLIQKTFL